MLEMDKLTQQNSKNLGMPYAQPPRHTRTVPRAMSHSCVLCQKVVTNSTGAGSGDNLRTMLRCSGCKVTR